MGNRCREGSLDKNNLPQSLNDNTHTVMSQRLSGRLACVLVYMWMQHSNYICLCDLHTICAKCANSIYSSIHNVSCYFPLLVTWFTSQTFYSAPRQTFSSLEPILDSSVAFVSLRIRSDVLSTCDVILKGAVPFRTLYLSFSKETKRFIITVRQ